MISQKIILSLNHLRKTIETETSFTSSQDDDIKICHHHETGCNAHLFLRSDCKRCCYAAQKEIFNK